MKPAGPHTPPPPYDEHRHERPARLETSVKQVSSLHKTDQDGAQGQKLQEMVSAYNMQHTCVGRQCDKREPRSDSRGQLIDSLVAPKKFIHYVTIEPLAFLAILAIYIEFPSIQDLIYTKICLQVVSNHSNLTAILNQTYPSVMSRDTNLQSIVETSQLSARGRISQMDTIGANQTISPIANLRPFNYQSTGHFICDRLNKTATPPDVKREISQLDSLFWLKYQLIICLLCGLSSPYWGGMSDKIGRLIPLNFPILMAAISNTISLIFGLLISMDSHHLFKIEWLYLGALLTGISGGQAIIIVNSFSVISDNSSSESRSKRMTVLETIIYLSHMAGFFTNKHIMTLGLSPIGSPWLNRHFVAFSLCVLLNLVCILYSVVKLRHHKFHRFLNNFEREQQETNAGELFTTGNSSNISGHLNRMDSNGIPTLGPEADINFGASSDRQRELTCSSPDDVDGPIAKADKRFTSWAVVLTLDYYRQTYSTITARRESRNIIWLLLFCGFISALSLTSLISLLYIYLRMDPFNWTTSQYSSWNSINSAGKGVALICLTLSMKFIRGWNVPDPLVAAVGFLSKGIGLTMIALAPSSAIIDWAPLALIFSEFSMPPMRSLLSKLVIHEEVGKIYSCLAAIQSLCFLAGNVIFYVAYNSLDLHNFFRISFIVVASLQFVAVLVMLSVYHHLRKRVIFI